MFDFYDYIEPLTHTIPSLIEEQQKRTFHLHNFACASQLHRTTYRHRSIINWEIAETNISPTKICLCVVQLQWHLYAPFNHKLRNSGNEISTYEMLLVSWQLHWTTYTHHSIIIYETAQNENSTYKTLLVFVQLHWTTYTHHSFIVWETRHNITYIYIY